MLKSLLPVAAAALLLGACASPQSPPPQVATTRVETARPTSFMVFFDWDRSDLSPQALSTIGQAAQAFKSNGTARITAIGHTDTSGPGDYNLALSLRRASAVQNVLIQDGVPAQAIGVVGRGKADLLVQTGDGVREPQNRRVEIVGGQQTASTSTIFSDPRAYCKALSDKYREYRNGESKTPESAAMYQCEQGNTAAGIPVLEDALIKANIPLPMPGYRWPGKSYAPS
jgi:outer membrane protein OmpA-like peptidoglycan-associated protein